MPTAAQLRSLWVTVPDRRTVTFGRRTATTPAYTSYTVDDAWYRPDVTQEGDPSQGVYLKRYRRWYLVKAKLADAGLAADPLPADTVTNAATTIDPQAGAWTVLRVGEVGALGAWELHCVLLEVRSALAVTVTVQRRTGAKDATGRMLPTTTSVATPSGWLQPDGSETVADLLLKTQLPTEGTVFLGTYQSDLRATDTLLVGSTSYNIRSMQNPQRLDELQSVRVELAR